MVMDNMSCDVKNNGGIIFASCAANDKNILVCQGPRVCENTGEALVASHFPHSGIL